MGKKTWKVPYIDGKPITGGSFWAPPDREIDWRDPVDFEATLFPVAWFPSRSTGGIVFIDAFDVRYYFTVKDLLGMLPHLKNGYIHGMFGWKKQGTTIFSTFLAALIGEEEN